MATVRFSGELKQDILSKARRLFDEKKAKASENYGADWGQIIYDGVFLETKTQMLALPGYYFERSNALIFDGFRGGAWDHESNVRIRVGLTEELPFPEKLPEGSHGLVKLIRGSDGIFELDSDDPRWKELKEEYKVYTTTLGEIRKECEEFVEGVEKVIETYATLAPALKAWPALWDLLPNHTKDRHREVDKRTTKAKAAEVAQEVDLNRLTAHVTADKLTR
jgi:hypothetical protein|tara:strand:- start:4678 stop:5343 length:666 start_codon:yes stop_codon:yes gene_type:complete